MKIYKDGSEPLYEILSLASSDQGATLLVPDLQRPYVWTPSQVTLLVDSLLKGWPFGTLLLWSVRKEELAGIPSRPFWRVVDRTNESDDQRVGKGNPPAQFRMVLDGQQRLQSLLLAFGGDAWGFRLHDHEWSTVLEAERPKGKNARKHWSLGHLCLDLNAFLAQLDQVGDLDKIDFRDVLSWVVQNPREGRSTLPHASNYRYPIESATDRENVGRFIRLSRLWALAPAQQRPTEKFLRDKLAPLLAEHDVSQQNIVKALTPLAELMSKVVDIKQASVSYLQLAPFDLETGSSQDVYNDAIVNIFTRLNTAGRALSRQEITFAWIKNGWGDGKQTENRTAGQCFDDLKEALAAAGVSVDIDSLVGAVSAMWSVIHRDGELLNASDLLRGEKVRPMAKDLVESWDVISINALDGTRLVGDRGVAFGIHYRSLNVLTLLLTWRLLGRQWLANISLGVTARDSFEKSLDALFNAKCDRWILMSQWSGRWGKSTDKTFAEYAKDLANDWTKISKLSVGGDVVTVMSARIDKWIGDLHADALKYVDDLAVLARNRVHDYYLPLWLWHRLSAERWVASKLQLREGKRGLSIEVDHIVAVALWETLPGAQQLLATSADSGIAGVDDLSTTMNALGNCCLLEKSFNISKGADSLGAFLARIHEFEIGTLNVRDWSEDLGLDSSLVEPAGVSAEEVRLQVEARTASIKNDLKAYLAGSLQRVDV